VKLLFENWKKYLKEGNVIQGPWADTPSPFDPELIDFVNQLENAIGKKLEDVHGRTAMDIPIEKIEQLDNVMKELDALFDIQDEIGDDHGEN